MARSYQLNSVSSRDMCVNWNEPQVAAYHYTNSLAHWTTLEYEMVDANEVCQKVRVEPATRSAVATCNIYNIYKWSTFWGKEPPSSGSAYGLGLTATDQGLRTRLPLGDEPLVPVPRQDSVWERGVLQSGAHWQYCRCATIHRRVAVQTRRRRTLALLTPGPRPVWARVWLRHWYLPRVIPFSRSIGIVLSTLGSNSLNVLSFSAFIWCPLVNSSAKEAVSVPWHPCSNNMIADRWKVGRKYV